MIVGDAEESNCSNSALSRSDRLDSEPSDEPVPPARWRWSSKSCSVEAFIVSMANSHESRDRLWDFVNIRWRAVIRWSCRGRLLKRMVLAWLGCWKDYAEPDCFSELEWRERNELDCDRPFFSKFISLALILVFGLIAPASSELDESCNVCWKSPVETADEMQRGAERDLIGVPASPLLLPGTALPPQVPVGIADGRSHGRWNRHGARNRSERWWFGNNGTDS